MKKGKIIGASVGNCVHVAGVIHFLSLAQDEGYDTIFLGPAVKIDVLFASIRNNSPEYVAIASAKSKKTTTIAIITYIINFSIYI